MQRDPLCRAEQCFLHVSYCMCDAVKNSVIENDFFLCKPLLRWKYVKGFLLLREQQQKAGLQLIMADAKDD